MDFSLTKEQSMLQEMVRGFVANNVEPLAEEIDKQEELPWEIVPKMGKLGLMGLTIPEEYGGSGGDLISMVISAEELSRSSGFIGAFYLAHLSLTLHPLFEKANEEQRQRFITPCARGEKSLASPLLSLMLGLLRLCCRLLPSLGMAAMYSMEGRFLPPMEVRHK